MRSPVVALLSFLLGTVACGGVTAATEPDAGWTVPDGGTPCSVGEECAADQICGYAESAGCAAHGECIPRSADTIMCIKTTSCGCDGGTIAYNVHCSPGLPGYVSTPILHGGACTSDGG